MWPETHFGYGCQPAAYRDAINKSKGKTKWLAIIDLDEYIIPMKRRNVKKTLLNDYKDSSAVYVNWLQFGTGGINIGPGPILPYLIHCAAKENTWNTIGKSIIRPEFIETCIDPHFCILKQPFEYFNGDGDMILDWKHHNKLLRINHYTFKDEWYFWNIKIPRYLKWNVSCEELIIKNKEFSKEIDTVIFGLQIKK